MNTIQLHFMKPTIALLFCLFCFSGDNFAGELDPSPTQQQWFKHYAKQENVPTAGVEEGLRPS